MSKAIMSKEADAINYSLWITKVVRDIIEQSMVVLSTVADTGAQEK